MDDNSIIMLLDDGSEIEYTILESATFGGNSYILVTDAPEEEDGECYVFKDVSRPEDTEAVYECVPDDEEKAVLSIFREMLEGDIDIEE